MIRGTQTRIASLCLATALLLTGCGNDLNDASSFNQNTPASEASLSDSLNSFGMELFQEVSKEDETKNVFISPASVSTALAMAYAGASGETADEMQRVLRFRNKPNSIGKEYYSFVRESSAEKELEGYTLTFANKIWGDDNLQWTGSYKMQTRKWFDSAMAVVDFNDRTKHQDIADEINTWAAEKTNNHIKNVISPDDFSNETSFALTNAAYFLADWEHPFPNEKFEDGTLPDTTRPFKTTTVGSVMVPFMKKTIEGLRYYEDESLQAVELPYKAEGGAPRLAMTILLPKKDQNNADVLKSVNGERLGQITQELTSTHSSGNKYIVNVNIPKWEVKGPTMNLTDQLKTMGMSIAFDREAATFANMAEDVGNEIYLEKVLHKTFVKVDEKGTEAAAVTVVSGAGVVAASIPIPWRIDIHADRPFVYAIRNIDSGAVLFVGKLANPAVNM